jgi:hypothetical protein
LDPKFCTVRCGAFHVLLFDPANSMLPGHGVPALVNTRVGNPYEITLDKHAKRCGHVALPGVNWYYSALGRVRFLSGRLERFFGRRASVTTKVAALAQLVEHWIVAPVVTGSIPVCRPRNSSSMRKARLSPGFPVSCSPFPDRAWRSPSQGADDAPSREPSRPGGY